MSWNFTNDKPIYLQLLEQIQFNIISGIYKSGEKLPTVREIATEASVNPNTVQKALSELERTGIVYSKRTVGRFITDDLGIINNTRSELAKKYTEIFIKNMTKIGYNAEEIPNVIENFIRGMK